MSASTCTREWGRAHVNPIAVALLLCAPTEAAFGNSGKPETERFPVSINVGHCVGFFTLECGDLLAEGEFVEWEGEQTAWHHTWLAPGGTGGWVQLKIDFDAVGIGETTGYLYQPDGDINKFRFEFDQLPFETTVTTTNVITAYGEPDGFFFVVHADYDVKVNASGETHVRTVAGFWSSECPVGTLYECGNGLCESGVLGEGCSNCPTDCGECSCGDGCCQADEDAASCSADCTAPGAVCEELSGPLGDDTSCSDTTPGNCVCQGCVDDGVCTSDDDCTCADCATDFVCGGDIFCFPDGVCDVFSEGCGCPECASAAPDCLL